MLHHGADPTLRNHKDESPLDLASMYGRIDAVDVLLKTKPNLVKHLTSKHSPLHLAARNGHKKVVRMLIEAKFDINYCVC